MAATLTISVIALCMQFQQIFVLLDVRTLSPLFDFSATRSLVSFGVFTWLQAAAALLFGQVDRILAGAVFGAAAVAAYTFCAQLTQPIYGVTAAGLHFLFPHLASKNVNDSPKILRRSIANAVAANLVFVAAALAFLLIFGRSILRVWAGPTISAFASPLLPAIAWSSALPAFAVSGSYALLALGKPRFVTAFNILGGVMMIAAIEYFIPHLGIAAIGYGRLLFGPMVLLVYVPLTSTLIRQNYRSTPVSSLPACEESR